jgi:hypothetical protein
MENGDATLIFPPGILEKRPTSQYRGGAFCVRGIEESFLKKWKM